MPKIFPSLGPALDELREPSGCRLPPPGLGKVELSKERQYPCAVFWLYLDTQLKDEIHVQTGDHEHFLAALLIGQRDQNPASADPNWIPLLVSKQGLR